MSIPKSLTAAALALAMTMPQVANAAERSVVQVPPEIRLAMAEVMRQQLDALNAVISAVAAGEFGKAAEIAEQGLGMTASARYGGARFSPYMPADMGRMGGATHRAGSRLAIALQDAELQAPGEAHASVVKALAAVTEGCNGCHAAFGFR
ncbi:MAG: hypothetical protein HY985_17380 [Magnetospirillum sp.]|nr:hypothetical protein [Magnetospirillum sp.]